MDNFIHLSDHILKDYHPYDEHDSYCGHYLDDFEEGFIQNTIDPDFVTCKKCLSLYEKQLKSIEDKKIKQKTIKKR